MISRLLRFWCWLITSHCACKEELRYETLSWRRCCRCGFLVPIIIDRID